MLIYDLYPYTIPPWSYTMNNLSWPVFRKVLATRPDLFASVGRATFRRKVTAKFDYLLGGGKSFKPPMQIDIKVTNRCDLRCFMCAQWGETGYNIGKSAAEIKGGECTAEDYFRLAREVSAWKPFIYVWGGEPLIYGDIQPVVEEFRAQGLWTSIVTNGTTLAKHADWIVGCGLDLLMVSIDGPAEVHDEVRRLPGAFDRLKEGLRAVKEARGTSSSNGQMRPYLAPLITINRSNTGHLEETFSVCADVGADFVGVYYSWFNDEEVGRAHVERFQHHFGETPTTWRGFSGGHVGLDVDELLGSIKKVKQAKWPFPYLFIPDLAGEEEVREYYANPKSLFGYKSCMALYFMTVILPNGDVATCRDYPDYVVGNIREQSLAEIFNNERYLRFRQALREDGLLPVCARCCGLMGY